jgi:hypothetical protein
MTDPVKEGWYADPADRDAISMSDPALFQSMKLKQLPGDGPLLVRSGQPASGPDPVTRPGIDPVGLRYTTRIVLALVPLPWAGSALRARLLERQAWRLPPVMMPL